VLFRLGAVGIGFGGGLFVAGTLTAVMAVPDERQRGLALGAWGAVQATAAGLALAAGGLLRDGAGALAASGALGPALADPFVGFSVVYHVETALLFATLVALGPLVSPAGAHLAGRRTLPADPPRVGGPHPEASWTSRATST
jgi:BCD family chlorophyll transporter-like MFS transporter